MGSATRAAARYADSYAGMSDEQLAKANPSGTNLFGNYAQPIQQKYDAEVRARKVKAAERAAAQRTNQMYATAPPPQPLATSSGDTSGPAREEVDTEDGVTSTRRRAQFRGAGGTAISI